jgi:type VI protein secretion system component VasK
MELRQQAPRVQSRSKLAMILGPALVLILLFAAAVTVFVRNRHNPDQIATASAPAIPLKQTIDLSNSTTTRGVPAQLSLVTLPKRMIDLTVSCPFSARPAHLR